MIHPDSRTLDWIEKIHSQYPKLDKQLIEKYIMNSFKLFFY